MKYKWVMSRDIAERAKLEKKNLRAEPAQLAESEGSESGKEVGIITVINEETAACYGSTIEEEVKMDKGKVKEVKQRK